MTDKVALGRSILYGRLEGPIVVESEWQTDGWVGFGMGEGWSGYREFFIEPGIVVHLPVTEKGGTGWELERIEDD